MQTATTARDASAGERLDRSRGRPMTSGAPVSPVKVWACMGAAFTALALYVTVKWALGPNFERVPVGPDQPPGWMEFVLMTGQILLPAVALFNVYWFIVRPWRRQRRMTFDGIFCISMALGSVWDPASNYLQNWFSYNSYLLNWGAPIVELPGFLAFHAPGAQIAWSFPFITGLYVGVVPWFAIGVCGLMRAVQRRFCRLTGVKLLALVYLVAVLFDILLEGVVFMPLGFWSYGGAWWPITGAGHYYQLPLNSALHAALFFTAVPAVRFFTNDKGETLAERGVSRIAGSPIRQNGLRILAVTGLIHALMFGLYHIPMAFWGGANSKAWPADITSRSYFMNHCGPQVNRACSGPNVPLSRPGSGYLDWNGNFVPGK